jgi:hypothetical protein
MRENRTYGSEGGEDISPLRPYRQQAQSRHFGCKGKHGNLIDATIDDRDGVCPIRVRFAVDGGPRGLAKLGKWAFLEGLAEMSQTVKPIKVRRTGIIDREKSTQEENTKFT